MHIRSLKSFYLWRWIFAIFPAFLLAGCGKGGPAATANEVVVYTALDQIYSEPILKAFEKQTGITVKAVYDAEAAKTTGLVSRLVAERERPRCDVFWNNEITRTIQFGGQGLLEPYVSPAAAGIPAQFKDPAGRWTGFAARARVLAYNTKLVKYDEIPRTMKALLAPRWKGKAGMAYPLFGTTASHAAFLYSKWGQAAALDYFKALRANGVKILEGNGASCEAVAAGELEVGLTDSDDASQAAAQAKPVAWVLIEDEARAGGLLIPNTLALVKGCPHAEAGRRLIDYLLSADVEAALAASPSAQIPLRPGVAAPAMVRQMAGSAFTDPQYEKSAAMLPASADDLKVVFGRQ